MIDSRYRYPIMEEQSEVRKRWSIRSFSRAWCGCTSCTTRPRALWQLDDRGARPAWLQDQPGHALPDAARPGTQGLSHLANGTGRPVAAPRLSSDSLWRRSFGDGAGESPGVGAGGGASGAAGAVSFSSGSKTGASSWNRRRPHLRPSQSKALSVRGGVSTFPSRARDALRNLHCPVASAVLG